MNVSLLGMGWTTPLGRGLDEVCAAVEAGKIPALHHETGLPTGRTLPVFRVPPESLTDVTALPRLRRSSAISHFAVAAACDAASALTEEQRKRTALVFVSTDGGVIYTRRFYSDIVERGPGSGSPLLFPETVYNAPASHIAARLGLEGEALTLVGDAEAGFDAIQTACELLACGDCDYCLVAAAQELDWITCEAYSNWKIGCFASGGATFSEGGAALLLGREPGCIGVQLVPRQPASPSLTELAASLPSPPDVVVSSNAGSPAGLREQTQLRKIFAKGLHFAPKLSLGEALACSSIQQVIFAALTLQKSKKSTSAAFATGFNHNVSALFLTRVPGHA
jgi:hypothetical protein